MESDKIIVYCKDAIEKFLDQIRYPYFLITEADMRSYLFNFLYNYKYIFRKPIFDKQTSTYTNILHTEYPYKMHGQGFYDVAILNPEKISKGSEDLKKKDIFIGIELKIVEDYSARKICIMMEEDSYAFDPKDTQNCADYGFVILINQLLEREKDEVPSIENDVDKIELYLKKLKTKRKLKNIFFYYFAIPDTDDYDIAKFTVIE